MSWPGTLPATPIIGGYQEVFANNVVRSDMDTGYAKVRKRSTAAPKIYRFVYSLTAAQVTTLNTFFDTTINSGADTFTMTHPRTSASETWRIISPPEVMTSANTSDYRAVVNMEQLP